MIKDDVIYIDVDETLLLSNELVTSKDLNLSLIEKIKEWKEEGKSIIVWTSNSGGKAWADKAVEICGIEDYVDLTLPKPHIIVDDDHLEYYQIIDPITLERK